MVDFDYSKLGELLKTARKQAGLNQSDVASRLDVTNPTISYMESGKNSVNLDVFLTLCDMYHINPIDILIKLGIVDTSNMSSLLPNESILIQNYRLLTDSGQQKVNDYMDDLIHPGQYLKE